MANTAAQMKYRKETVMGFEKDQALSRHTVTTEVDIKGLTATFLVADSGGAEARTRGFNGLISPREDSLEQPVVTLVEWHDLVERSGFNLYTSQGDGRAIMQQTTRNVMNRKIDKDIAGSLTAATATWNTGNALTAKVAAVVDVTIAKTKLGNAFAASRGDEIYAQITPAYYGQLMALPEFVNRDYIKDSKFDGVSVDEAFAWYGVRWIVNPDLDGAGTNNAQCFMYNKKAVGHACNTSGMDVASDYDNKQDMSWARTSMYMGSKLLQDAGVIKMPHDDSPLSATT